MRELENVLGTGREEGKNAHVLFVTIQYPGHFAPMVQLLYHLEEIRPGLAVTVWSNDARIADVQKLQLKGDLKRLALRLEVVFGESPIYAADPNFPTRAANTSFKCLQEAQPFLEKLVAQKGAPGAPTAIVSDMFQHWSKGLADDLGIPWYTYFSTGTSFIMNVALRSKMIEAGVHPTRSPNLDDLLDNSAFPGFPSVRIRDLTEEIFFFENFYLDVIEQTKLASAILLNTSEELDSAAGSVVALRKLWPSTRILPIGPSLQYPGFGKVYTSTFSVSSGVQWLDSRPANSVLFVAFGSIGSIAQESVMELAAGLEASGVPFLWALKVPPTVDLSKFLPEGFEERTRGQGIIEKDWVPQVRILAHPSTGGFLSHCGWNSTLESLCAGVPLIAWPLGAEQPMNARFIADVAKVGVTISNFKDDDKYSNKNITGEVVTRAARELMLEKKGDELRENTATMAKSLLRSVAKGGSSYENLHRLLDELTSAR